MTPQSAPQSNPLAHNLAQQYGAQLLEILKYVDCTTVGVSGMAGVGSGEIATDEQCKWLRINFNAEFPIKITRDLAQQVIDGLEKQQEYLAKDIERLRVAVAEGKFLSRALADSIEPPRSSRDAQNSQEASMEST